MNNAIYPLNTFSEDEIGRLSAAMKVGILATISPDGLPHLTMISTLMAAGPQSLAWGQFTEGLSKQYVCQNPRTGFLIMTLDRTVWCGKACYTTSATSGKEYDFYNSIPMFRYNAYFGIHTVHYMDLVAHSGPQSLPMNRIVVQALLTLLARKLAFKPAKAQPVMNSWTRAFMNQLDHLKFLGYIDADGYPVIIPVIQAQAFDAGRVVFSTGVYSNELESIPTGTALAVFGLSLSMEDVLLRGIHRGVRRLAGVPCALVELNWAYNSMPPTPGQIYPPLALEPVREF